MLKPATENDLLTEGHLQNHKDGKTGFLRCKVRSKAKHRRKCLAVILTYLCVARCNIKELGQSRLSSEGHLMASGILNQIRIVGPGERGVSWKISPYLFRHRDTGAEVKADAQQWRNHVLAKRNVPSGEKYQSYFVRSATRMLCECDFRDFS